MRKGDVIWNPLTGEKAMLIESTEESGGRRIVTDFAVEEGGFVPGGEHRHDHCTEHFIVERGRITFAVNGRQQTLGPGEELTVPAGTWHRWWNAGTDEVRMTTTVEPALRFEEAIMIVWGLCADGKTNAKGVPPPLIGALVATRYRDEITYRKPPQLVQRTIFGALAVLARRLGKDKVLDRYLDPVAHPSAELGRGSLPERVMTGAAR